MGTFPNEVVCEVMTGILPIFDWPFLGAGVVPADASVDARQAIDDCIQLLRQLGVERLHDAVLPAPNRGFEGRDIRPNIEHT